MKITRKLWLALIILALLTPLGVLLPYWLKAGGAWGEWKPEELKGRLGYAPGQLERLSHLWHALLPDYGPPGAEQTGVAWQSALYLLSALVGIGLVVGLAFLLGRWLAKNESDTGVDDRDTGAAG